ncbi:SMC-Scp complex subunit ScpB [bacterium]|nr:SMC-Scp complex subunit ScpB [bacterium]
MSDKPNENESPLGFEAETYGGLNVLGALEAMLFASDHPIQEQEISETLGVKQDEVASLTNQLDQLYQQHNHGIALQHTGAGWRLVTRSEYSEIVKRHLRLKQKTKLSRAALECISIVAYRQPVSRMEVEEIRGVDSSQVLRNLLERDLIKIKGRAEVPGRPLLYGTTDSFLAYFGLDSLVSLPKPEELLGEQEPLEFQGNGPDGPFDPNQNSDEVTQDE